MRTRHVVAVAAVVGVVVAGCSGDDGALDLTDDDGTAAPVETEPPVEVTEDPDPPPPDDDEEPLYPPLPPLEPDPDSDIPVDEQQAFLDLHARVYEATQQAFADIDYDLDQLERVLAGAALDEARATADRFRAEGRVSLSPDAEVAWVRVVEASGGPGIVEECRRYGPRTGLYDVATGELVEAVEVTDVILEVRYDVVMVDERLETYAVEVGGRSGEDGCA